MRKLLFLAIVSLFTVSGLMAQGNVLIQTVDTMQCNEEQNIENRLNSFYKANRNSQFMLVTGAVVGVAGTLLFKPKEDQINPFPLLGGACGLAGFVIYFDSFKFLNMNKKLKIRSATPVF